MWHTVNDVGRMLEVKETTLRRWLTKFNVSVSVNQYGTVLVTEEGVEELRSIISVKNQIKELEELRFRKPL